VRKDQRSIIEFYSNSNTKAARSLKLLAAVDVRIDLHGDMG
jgi:hypothetical protein